MAGETLPRELVLVLPPAELAGYLLMEALRIWRSNHAANPRSTSGLTLRSVIPNELREDEAERLSWVEAWNWLVREGLLVPNVPPTAATDTSTLVPSRRARELKTRVDFERLRDEKFLPRSLLHPIIRLAVETDFFTGDYDEAVMKAFRRVEIAIRDAANLGDDLVGTTLASAAFNPQAGPLTDSEVADKGERAAMMNLFSGAIGVFRNPPSHREIGLTAESAIEQFIIASHLMRIVDSRKTALRPTHEQGGTNASTGP